MRYESNGGNAGQPSDPEQAGSPLLPDADLPVKPPALGQLHRHSGRKRQAYVNQLIRFYLQFASLPAGLLAGWGLCLAWSRTTRQVLMIMKLRSSQEASITWRIHTLRPTIVLAAMWRFKHRAWLSACLALLLSAASSAGQGTFQNLNFEAAQIPSGTQPNTGSFASISDALPGWSGSFSYGTGIQQVNEVCYDGVSLGGPLISIIDHTSGLSGSYHSLQGTYSPFLFGGIDGYGRQVASTISQTELVPNGTTSILMDVYGYPVQAWYGFSVSLAGQPVNMVPMLTFPSYTLYRGDISAFAGQTAQLSITALPPPRGDVDPSGILIDDIRFVTVPEPSIFALSALGAFLIGRRIQRGRR